jgi:hypothetical protein
MSSSNWTDYFQIADEPAAMKHIAVKTLLDLPMADAPAEKAEAKAPSSSKPKKKPKKKPSILDIPTGEEETPPAKVDVSEAENAPLSIFEVDPSDQAVLEGKEPPTPKTPPAPATPATAPGAVPEDALWEQFLKETFGPQGGKTQISNTNPKTKTKYPKVQVDTLLKSDQAFYKDTVAKYEAWKAKHGEEGAPKTPEQVIAEWEEAREKAKDKATETWPGLIPEHVDWDDEALASVVEKAKELDKIPLIKWLRGSEESPWAPVPIEADHPHGSSYNDHRMGLKAAKDLAEDLLDHLAGKEKTPLPVDPSEVDWDEAQYGAAVSQGEELTGKKIALIKWLRSAPQSPWSQDKTGFHLGLLEAKKLAESLLDHLKHKNQHKAPADVEDSSINFDDPAVQKAMEDLAEFIKEKAAVPWKEGGQKVWAMKWLIHNEEAFGHVNLAKAKEIAIQLLAHPSMKEALKKPEEEIVYGGFPDLPQDVQKKVNTALVKANHDLDESVMSLLKGLHGVKDALGEYADKFDYVEASLKNMMDAFQSSEVPDDHEISMWLQKQLNKHQATKPGAPPVEELPEVAVEEPEESKPKKKLPKKKKSPKGKYEEITGTGQLETGDVVVYQSGGKTYKAVVMQTWPSGAVQLKKVHAKSGKLWGKTQYLQAHTVADKISKKYTHATIPLHMHDIPEVQALLEGPKPGAKPVPKPKAPKLKPGQASYEPPKGAPKPHKGEHVQQAHQVDVGDAVTWKVGSKEFYGRVTDTKDGNLYIQSVDPKTGAADKMYVFGQWDLNNVGLGKIGDDEVPKKFKVQKVPPKPQPPSLPPPPEKPISLHLMKVEGDKVEGMDDVKEGDYLTWMNTEGDFKWGIVVEQNTYNGVPNWEVQKLDPDTAQHVGGHPNNFYISDSENKFTKRNPHKLSPAQVAQRMTEIEEHKKALKEWQPKYKAWEQEKIAAEKEYQEQLQDWEAQKDAIKGTAKSAVSPIKKTSVDNLGIGENSNWNLNSHLIRLADDYVPQIFHQSQDWLNGSELEKHIESRKQNYDPTTNIPSAGSAGGAAGKAAGKKLWEQRSEGERELLLGAPWLAQHFMHEVLTPEERNSLQSHVSDWQGSANSSGAVALKGIVDSAIPALHKGKKPSGETAKVLERALAKAMAWSQVLFDHFGVDKMSLFRGAGAGGTTNQGLKPGDTVVAEATGGGKGARSLTGFSSSPYVANGFGSGLTYTRVPAAHALLTPFHFLSLAGGSGTHISDPNKEWEAEYFVGGIQDLPWKFAGKSGSLGKWDFDKMKIATVMSAHAMPQGYASFKHLQAVLQGGVSGYV